MTTTTEVSSRRQQTRERLMAAATELFAEKSVQGATVEEICERAGFTRGAFYSNFESKDELCLELVRGRGRRLIELIRKALAAIPDAVTEHTLAEVIAKTLAVFDAGFSMDDNWVFVRAELRLYAHRTEALRPALIEAEQEANELATQAIGEALARQHAELLVPLEQLMLTLDSYCERARLDEILAGVDQADSQWKQGLEHLLRALVVLPRAERS